VFGGRWKKQRCEGGKKERRLCVFVHWTDAELMRGGTHTARFGLAFKKKKEISAGNGWGVLSLLYEPGRLFALEKRGRRFSPEKAKQKVFTVCEVRASGDR